MSTEEVPVELDSISAAILSLATMLDGIGAMTWNLNVVAIVSAVVLTGIKVTMGDKWGIDWLAFIHSLITGVGGIMIAYFDFMAAELITGEADDARTARCGEPALTCLHRILPAIVFGYSVFDVVAGLFLGWDFILHGISTFIVFGFFVEHDVSHMLGPMLLMEVSTIFLTLVRFEYFSPTMSLVNQMCFALSFFICRVVLVPYIWIGQVRNLLREEALEENWCQPWYFNKFILAMGVVFHGLNAFWFYKIVRKIMRKMSGNEKIQERNDLKEQGDTKKTD